MFENAMCMRTCVGARARDGGTATFTHTKAPILIHDLENVKNDLQINFSKKGT